MKVALTADVHLTSKKDHPERFNAFSDILGQTKALGIEHLIVAGDLFDQSLKNYAEFDALCKLKKHQGIQLHIIPGNHDPDLTPSQFVSENVHIYTEPTLLKLDPSSFPFLLLPYQPSRSMGEALEGVSAQLPPREWLLVGHGNFSGGLQAQNPLEPGFYMPLTSKDIERNQPREVFLGHIHESPDHPRVHYCGSPCGLDINETGKRYFLVYDTEDHSMEKIPVNVDRIFLQETIIVLPTEDELAFVRQACKERIEAWGLSQGELARVILRIRVVGYCSDKAAVDRVLKEIFSPFPTWKEEGIDISGVFVSDDRDRQHICEQVRERVDALVWADGADEPTKDEILTEALHLIYGE